MSMTTMPSDTIRDLLRQGKRREAMALYRREGATAEDFNYVNTAASIATERGITVEDALTQVLNEPPASIPGKPLVPRSVTPGEPSWITVLAPLAAAGMATLTVLAAASNLSGVGFVVAVLILPLPYLLVAGIMMHVHEHPATRAWRRVGLCVVTALLSLASILMDLFAALVLGWTFEDGAWFPPQFGAANFLALLTALLGLASFVAAVHRAVTSWRAGGQGSLSIAETGVLGLAATCGLDTHMAEERTEG